MTHFRAHFFPRPALLVSAVALAVLAGCATRPDPVHQQPSPTVYQYPTQPAPAVDYRRRANEPLYEAPVTSVRAVLGPDSGQRCWIEREQVESRRSVPGAIVGGVIGGVLGHQIGGGTGRDIATVGGAVAGAAVGSNVGRGTQTQDVQRCTNVGSNTPEYWDVSYSFRGVQHHVQLTSPPGRTILVNGNGEPRI
ncbi:glycine zipper 2TM domain-containing protein [Hydrogenophaga laconesensis]|uniref:Small secreted protein n=1 Tax=Hydrogenophaga laconesensis TaxID=1805971 RepID=A0ABU1V8D5_9BURK|nr:glycine zipper 2TM domain-containing protein [Hydrogenophaga laconesensis]MDR7093724.1 putative small secreted protein [Hydrogenophaga laconesensis]